MKLSNIEMEIMMEKLKPLLHRRDRLGYVAARNVRIFNDALFEYFDFKRDLLRKYGELDKDENGNETVSISPSSPNFNDFLKEFNTIKSIEQDVELMTLSYEDVVGLLSGEEILELDWMLSD